MSIKDNLLKIKSKIVISEIAKNRATKTAVFALILVTVFTFSFQLGRLVSLRDTRTTIVLGSFEAPAQDSVQAKITEKIDPKTTKIKTNITTVNSQEVVASKQGKTYHLPSCSGAKNISSENRITFASQELAQKAGYSPAKNCKGLLANTKNTK